MRDMVRPFCKYPTARRSSVRRFTGDGTSSIRQRRTVFRFPGFLRSPYLEMRSPGQPNMILTEIIKATSRSFVRQLVNGGIANLVTGRREQDSSDLRVMSL